jgi:excinuclease ABC subunit C
VLPEVVQRKLDALPVSPGVYLFKDARGEVVYIGKASSLRNRVRSYFQSTTDTRYFIATLANEIGDLETFVTATEKEAALLENHLIKEHQPRYNVKLRDDKQYMSLRLDAKAAWPRLEVVRKPKSDGALYFGPYHSASAARQTLRLVNRHFQLRTCTDTDFASRRRPCLQHQIMRCPGPCVLPVDREAYGQQVGDVALFLNGRHDELVVQLGQRMQSAAEAQNYEQAAVHRDQIRAIETSREQQRVSVANVIDQDVIGMHRQAEDVEVAVLMIRSGKLVGVRTYALDHVRLPDAEVIASFIAEYYARGSYVPDEILFPLELDASEGLAAMLAERRENKRAPAVFVPKRGARSRLVEMATENAAHAFREKSRAKTDIDEKLGQLMKRLRLPKLPRRIECIDISHTGGTDTVAAVVALYNGEPDRKRYKSFHVKRVSGGDDYGAMYEVLTRRLRRGREQEVGWELPDLLLVDGGKGQLNVALAAMRDMNVVDLPVAGLAKEKENVMGDKLVDRIYLPGQKNSIALREGSTALYFLALARDEAHRSSNSIREKLGKRKRLRTGLEDVPGVGTVTRKALLRTLGSLKAVRTASAEELVAAGATKAQARAIRHHFASDAVVPVVEAPATDEGTVAEPATQSVAENEAVEHAFISDDEPELH